MAGYCFRITMARSSMARLMPVPEYFKESPGWLEPPPIPQPIVSCGPNAKAKLNITNSNNANVIITHCKPMDSSCVVE